MSKKRKFLLASWLLCASMVIGGATACFNSESESSSSQDGGSSDESVKDSIPEGTVDFDESWVDE